MAVLLAVAGAGAAMCAAFGRPWLGMPQVTQCQLVARSGHGLCAAPHDQAMILWMLPASTCLSVVRVSSRSRHHPSRKFSAMILHQGQGQGFSGGV
jgi:hypothetical protein